MNGIEKYFAQRMNEMVQPPMREFEGLISAALETGPVHRYEIGNISTEETGSKKLIMQPADINKYAPTRGIDELLQAIIQLYQDFGINGLKPENLLIGNGASELGDMVAAAFIDPGDEVVVPMPTYTNWLNWLIKYGAKIKPVNRFFDQENFALDLNLLNDAITDKTKAILLINPDNPTGYVYSRKELQQICEAVIEHDVLIFADETYTGMVFDGVKCWSLLEFSDIQDRLIVLNSASKRELSPGWHVGWGISRNTKIIDALIEKLATPRLAVCTPAQIATALTIKNSFENLPRLMADLQQRRDLMCNAFREIGIPFHKPQGAIFIVADFGFDAKDFLTWVLEDYHIGKKESFSAAPLIGFYNGENGRVSNYSRFAIVPTQARIPRGMAIVADSYTVYKSDIYKPATTTAYQPGKVLTAA